MLGGIVLKMKMTGIWVAANADPSGIDCFVEGLMESRDWIFDIKTGSWVIAEQLQSEIKAMPARAVNEQKLQMFQRFLESIK
jgi:hypothetical protein